MSTNWITQWNCTFRCHQIFRHLQCCWLITQCAVIITQRLIRRCERWGKVYHYWDAADNLRWTERPCWKSCAFHVWSQTILFIISRHGNRLINRSKLLMPQEAECAQERSHRTEVLRKLDSVTRWWTYGENSVWCVSFWGLILFDWWLATAEIYRYHWCKLESDLFTLSVFK